MKLVFTHDHRFKKDTLGNYYTGGSFNNTVWKRYLKHFSHVTVLARLDKELISPNNTYNDFNLPDTSFVPIPSINGPVNMMKNKKEAKNIIKEQLSQADGLIARLPSEIGNLSIDIANKLDKPYIIEAVACVWDSLWNYGSPLAKIYAPLAMQRMKKRIKVSNYTIYVTNEFLQSRYPTKGKNTSISNVEIQSVSHKALEQRLERYKRNKGLYTIGMIGSLNNNIKGWDVAFKALSKLKKDGFDFTFKVLGDGNSSKWKPILEQLDILNNVKFCGVLPGGVPVLNWLDEIDLYIQPSYQEGLPRAVIEAMSRGCPVIGSSAGGIPELIHPSMIHKPGNVDKLYSLIKETLINSNSLLSNAKINFKLSKEYLKDNLDRKRYGFLNSVFEKQN